VGDVVGEDHCGDAAIVSLGLLAPTLLVAPVNPTKVLMRPIGTMEAASERDARDGTKEVLSYQHTTWYGIAQNEKKKNLTAHKTMVSSQNSRVQEATLNHRMNYMNK
jgi:hypothetical protein